jgi:hypothetical protein
VSSPEPRVTPATRLLLWIAVPLALLAALQAGVAGFASGGVVPALQLAAIGLLGGLGAVGGLVALVGLIHVLQSTRGGAIALDDPRQGHPISVDLGGTEASAMERARAAVLGLAGAAITREDARSLEARADGRRFGNKTTHHVALRVDGTVVTGLVRHDDRRKPLDFGTTRRQAEALQAALVAAAEVPAAEREPVRRSIRAVEDRQ